MSKQSLPFSFQFELTKQVVQNLTVLDELVAILFISGTGYFDDRYSMSEIHDRYKVDIDFITYNRVDIKPVLEAVADIDEITEAACKHVAELFSNEPPRLTPFQEVCSMVQSMVGDNDLYIPDLVIRGNAPFLTVHAVSSKNNRLSVMTYDESWHEVEPHETAIVETLRKCLKTLQKAQKA